MTPRRWFTVLGAALVLSLAVNFFLGGLVLGRGVGQGGGMAWASAPALRVGIERVLRTLPDGDRKLVRGMFEEQKDAIMQKLVAFREARRGVAQALKAVPFNPDAFAAAYQTMQDRNRDLQEAIHAVIKAAVPQLSPAGREAMAEGRWRQ
ncbi:MAG TPA: periplasmic heavy metal sensor [Methylomirabilota bacterium]|nr:periplasmic heavy metal sensor [Methylomirabilota bacterium]